MKKRGLALLVITIVTCAFGLTARGGAPGVDPNVFVNLAKKIVPSVVNIQTLSVVRSPFNRGGNDDLFRRFFEDFFRQHGGRVGPGAPQGPGDEDDEGGPSQGDPRTQPHAMSLGTGFIIDASGLILTNNHVVANADEIKVQFTEAADEQSTDGEVVGRDPELDLALIKVKSQRQMTPVALGDSDALEVGEYVIAVGNPFGQGHSVTHGIISAKERKAPDMMLLANYLQTDAPINPGNSGGPLVNLKGEVIGINNAIDQRAQGIGFAIPISLVKKVLPQLRTKGTVSRGYIGVLVGELTPEIAAKMSLPKDARGPFVTHVYPDGPAAKAGVKPYDVISQFNGKPVHSATELINAVTAVPVGDSVSVLVRRGTQEKTFNVKIAQRPGMPEQAKADGKHKKKSDKPSRVDAGMDLEDMTAETARELGVTDKPTGVVVTAITYGGPADKAGLMRGDIILEVDRKAIKDTDSFFAIVKSKKSYLLRVRRGDPQGRETFSVIVLDFKE